jgi:hypothetical protein
MRIEFKSFINENKYLKSGLGKNLIINKKDIKSHYSGWLNQNLQPSIEKNYNKIVFGFCNSILVLENGDIISNSVNNRGITYSYTDVLKFDIKRKGFLSKGDILDNNKKVVGTCFGNDFSVGISLFDEFIKFLKENPPKEKIVTKTKPTTKNKKVTVKKKIEVKKKKKTKRELQKELVKLISNQNKELNDVSKIRNSIKIKQSSILKESFLNKTPITLNFTVVISSKMKSIQNDFNDSQLNKLTRFLSFLEENEVKYNSLYKEGVNQYIDNPESDVFQQISVKYLSILNYYQIFSLMLNNINTDKVTFNKLYNIIEDEGIFMTRTEVDTMDYFKKISKGISQLNNNLISEFNKLNKGINNLNLGLQYLDGSLQMIDSSLSLIEKNTNNIYLTI